MSDHPAETGNYDRARMGACAVYTGITDAQLQQLFDADDLDMLRLLGEFPTEGAPTVRLGEVWDGLHFLLTGVSADSPIEGDPLSEAVVGVHLFDTPVFIGCTEHDELDAVTRALTAVDIDGLVRGANFRDFDHASLWPYDWSDYDDERAKGLVTGFRELTRFTVECAAAGLHLVVAFVDTEQSQAIFYDDAAADAAEPRKEPSMQDGDESVPALPELPPYALSVDHFWEVIGLLDWDETGDDEAVLAPAVAALALRSVDEIHGFSEILARYLFVLDTREHARYGYLGEADPDDGDDYISADDFLYLRCAVVANGRELTERVIADPSQMLRDYEFEALLSLADKAYERKTGDEDEYDAEVSYESFSNTDGWAGTTSPGIYTDEAIPPGNRRP